MGAMNEEISNLSKVFICKKNNILKTFWKVFEIFFFKNMYRSGYVIDEIHNGPCEPLLVSHSGAFDPFDILALKMCNQKQIYVMFHQEWK